MITIKSQLYCKDKHNKIVRKEETWISLYITCQTITSKVHFRSTTTRATEAQEQGED